MTQHKMIVTIIIKYESVAYSGQMDAAQLGVVCTQVTEGNRSQLFTWMGNTFEKFRDSMMDHSVRLDIHGGVHIFNINRE